MWLSIALAGPAFATVVNTRTPGVPYNSVSAAVSAALPGDTLVVDGVYDEHVVVDRDLTLQGAPGATIRFEGGSEVIQLTLGVSLTMDGVDVTSGTTRALRGVDGGNWLDLANLTIRGTATGAGGGVQLTDPAFVVMYYVVFDGTSATTTGGAISVSASTLFPMALGDTVFLGTSAGTNGGAVYLDTTDFWCERCLFEGTTANASGGAIYDADGSSVEVHESSFEDTTAAINGGAIVVAASTTSLVVERSGFCGSTANAGGAIFGAAQAASLRASTFVGGGAFNGGALHVSGGAWTVQNNHFLETAGGAAVDVSGAATSMTLVNDLFARSLGLGVQSALASVDVSYSNFYWNAGNTSGSVNLGAGNLFVEPVLRVWSPDGDCSNDDLRPAWDSPLVDAGDPALRDTDPTRSDIGAYGGPASDPANHTDGDGDGVRFFRDCDDDEPRANALEDEVCDGVDNDCVDGIDVGALDEDAFYQDCDRDGQGDWTTEVAGCDPPAVVPPCVWLSSNDLGAEAWSDCDDRDRTVYFGADELCDPGDQDCDGDDDLGATDAATYYVDLDGDLYGDPGTAFQTCDVSPPDAVLQGGDCNDAPARSGDQFHPGAPDPCGDTFDSDCDGLDGDVNTIRDWYPDADSDGYGDLNGAVERDCEERSADGLTELEDATDCDDTLDSVHPGATEECNLVDDDCDDAVDDVETEAVEWFADRDLDRFGDRALPYESACPPEEGWIETGRDCDDTDDQVHPDATETCNHLDDDCDDLMDAADPDAEGTVERWPDADRDGFGACDDGSGACPPEPLCPYEDGVGWADNPEDCEDGIDEIHPDAVDVPGDDLDQDCSGTAEPGDGPGSEPDPKGCGCNAGPTTPAGALVAPLLLLAIRRRRR